MPFSWNNRVANVPTHSSTRRALNFCARLYQLVGQVLRIEIWVSFYDFAFDTYAAFALTIYWNLLTWLCHTRSSDAIKSCIARKTRSCHHMYASVNWVIIGPNNSLLVVRKQSITWTDVDVSEINFASKLNQANYYIACVIWRHLCRGLNVLIGNPISSATWRREQSDITNRYMIWPHNGGMAVSKTRCIVHPDKYYELL